MLETNNLLKLCNELRIELHKGFYTEEVIDDIFLHFIFEKYEEEISNEIIQYRQREITFSLTKDTDYDWLISDLNNKLYEVIINNKESIISNNSELEYIINKLEKGEVSVENIYIFFIIPFDDRFDIIVNL